MLESGLCNIALLLIYDYKYHIPIDVRKWALKHALIFTIMSTDRSLFNFNIILLYVIRDVSADRKFHFSLKMQHKGGGHQ
jgi:hypothetical protein